MNKSYSITILLSLTLLASASASVCTGFNANDLLQTGIFLFNLGVVEFNNVGYDSYTCYDIII